jgi:hypothetical protein
MGFNESDRDLVAVAAAVTGCLPCHSTLRAVPNTALPVSDASNPSINLGQSERFENIRRLGARHYQLINSKSGCRNGQLSLRGKTGNPAQDDGV